jgi:hypothetical protein
MNPRGRQLRWFARMLATVPTVFGWSLVVSEAAAGEDGDGEGIAVGLGFAFLTAATAATWRWERIGAAAEIVAAVVFAIIVYVTAGHNRVLVALILPSPWLVSGVLLLAIGAIRHGNPADSEG